MRKKIFEILVDVYYRDIDYEVGTQKILSLLDENEVGVSDASTKHGDLPPVREWNAHGPEADSQIASEHGAFRNRIEAKEVCPKCDSDDLHWEHYGRFTCLDCRHKFLRAKLIDS